MGILSVIEDKMKECSNQLFNMCKIRTKEERDCAMSKCCGICNKILECKGRCNFLKNNIPTLHEYI
jgi:hypothetical protein